MTNNLIKIENGKVYVEGVETRDPTLIGFAVLDYAEKMEHAKMLEVA